MPQLIEVPGYGEVEFPDDMSDEQIAQAIQQNMAPKEAPKAEGPSGLESFGVGLRDPITGAAQLMERAVPDSVARKVNQFNNWLVDKGVPLERVAEENAVDDLAKRQEQDYQGRRMAAGETGIDWPRVGGNIATSVLATRGLKNPATLAGRMKQGAAVGAGLGLTAPVTSGDDFWTQKGVQGLTGFLAGGAVPLAGAGVARMIKPNTRPEVSALMKEGVTPTPGQILGGRWQVLEDKATSIPIVGDAISSARGKSLDEFNRAALSRAVKPIGGEVPKSVGRDAVREVRQQLGQAYDDLLPKVSFKADQQFASELNNLRSMVSQLPETQAKQFDKIFQTQLQGKMTPQGLMNGARLKEVESELRRIASGYSKDPSFDNRQLGSAITELQNMIRSNLARTNPAHAKRLSDINKGYANYARLRDAASRQGSAEGKFTPAQLSAAVRSGDKTVGKRAFSEGDALLQDLSDAGKNVLASKYPDSGSIGRLALGAGVAAPAAWLSPTALGGAGLATLPYLPGGRQAMAALLTKRPELAGALANQVRGLSTSLAGSGGLLAAGDY